MEEEVLVLELDINCWVIAANYDPQKTLAALEENKDPSPHFTGAEAKSGDEL